MLSDKITEARGIARRELERPGLPADILAELEELDRNLTRELMRAIAIGSKFHLQQRNGIGLETMSEAIARLEKGHE